MACSTSIVQPSHGDFCFWGPVRDHDLGICGKYPEKSFEFRIEGLGFKGDPTEGFRTPCTSLGSTRPRFSREWIAMAAYIFEDNALFIFSC